MGCASRRRAVPVAGLALVLLTGAATPAGNPAAAVAAAAGHPARLHLHAEADRTVAGERATVTLDALGPQRLERTCAQGLCTGSWFDGRHQTRFGINGTPLPDDDPGDAAERTSAAIVSTAFAEAEFSAQGGSVRVLPQTTAGKERFAVRAPGGTELVAIVDAANHRLIGIESPPGDPPQPLTANFGAGTVLYADRPFNRVETLDGALVPPAGPPLAVGAAADVVLLSTALPIATCRVEGRAARCLLDSGTTPSAVTLGFAEALEREPHGSVEIEGLTSYLTGVIEAGPILLGGARFEHLALAVIPGRRTANFDVILGADALAGLRLTFDPGRHHVRVDASAANDGPGIPLSFRGGLPYVPVRLAERDQTEAMLLDTGDEGTLSIGYDEYREQPDLFEVRGAGAAAGAAGPAMSSIEGTLAHAEIGGEPHAALPISAVRGQHVGHVGYGFAARCAPFVLDVGRHVAQCAPNGAPDASHTPTPGQK